MATDYDTPRKTDDDLEAESLELLTQTSKDTAKVAAVDLEETFSDSEPVELPGADLSGERLEVVVLPKQADEFTCTRCFLVMHKSMQAPDTIDRPVCLDCS